MTLTPDGAIGPLMRPELPSRTKGQHLLDTGEARERRVQSRPAVPLRPSVKQTC